MASPRWKPLPAWAAVLSLALGAQAVTKYCPAGTTDVCYSVGVPDSTASAGSGNIYFRISAPTSYQWVALGTGSAMAGSNMFIMYQDGSGNVTLSPRLGTSHAAPSEDTSSTAAQLTLLAGSGVSNGTMTANVVCANCESWGTSGKLSVTSTSAPWIGAWKTGSSLATTNKNVALSKHDSTTQYQLDMTMATIATDSNPFLSSDSSSSSSSSSGTGSGDDSASAGGVTVLSSSPNGVVLTAHAVIITFAMVVLYPLGSALMPLMGKWLVHGIWQGIAYLLMWIGFALGVVAAQQRSLLFVNRGTTHTLLGTVVVAAMAIQPLLGVMHHRHYVKYQRRGLVSHWHIWWGRGFMLLGIVNGGLGLSLSFASNTAIIGYAAASVVLLLAYVVAKVVGTRILAPARARKQLDGGLAFPDNSRRYGEDSYGAAGRRGPGPGPSYREQYEMQRQPSRPQADTGYKDARDGSDSSTDYAMGGSSAPPSQPPTRPAQWSSNAPGRSYAEEEEQYRNRMRRDERRYA